jgi:hypothetical protein
MMPEQELLEQMLEQMLLEEIMLKINVFLANSK